VPSKLGVACFASQRDDNETNMGNPRHVATASNGPRLFFLTVILMTGYFLSRGDLTNASYSRRGNIYVPTALPPNVLSNGANNTFSDVKTTLYVYEKNMKTGSTSWDVMIREAEGKVDVTECRSSILENAIRVIGLANLKRDTIVSCHTRRMSIPRSVNVRIITSFNLEKDMLTSAFLQWKNLTIAEFDRSGDEYSTFKNNFQICWSLIYMGYAENDDDVIRSATCPLSSALLGMIDIAIMDTYLPISHDLPCISRRLLLDMVGLKVKSEMRLNVRNGISNPTWEHDKSCVDVEITKRLTQKMLALFDGTSLDLTRDWRAHARAKDDECSILSRKRT
jgi:hypothetical protein